MAATVEISETNGASGAPVTTNGISNINFGSVDAPNLVPASHPIVLSIAGATYAFTKWLRFHLVALGGSTTIANLKYWKSSGALLSQEHLCGTSNLSGNINACITAGYAKSTAGTGGSAVTTPYSGNGTAILTTDWVSASAFVLTAQPASACVSIAGALAGTLTAAGYSDYIAMCLVVDGSGGSPTPSGAVNQKVLTFQYDES